MNCKSQDRSGILLDSRAVLKIILSYMVCGSVWVICSDTLVYEHGGESLLAALLGLGKGLLFVALSALLLYGLMSRAFSKVMSERASLRERLRTWELDANDIVLLLDESGAVVEANDRAATAYGYHAQALYRKNIADLLADQAGFKERWATLLRDGTSRSEVVHRRADGSEFPIECSARSCELNGSVYIHCVIRDISSRQNAERQPVRLKDAYAALSGTNQCINQSLDRDTLFQQTCDIAARYTNVQLSWIGIIEVTDSTVKPVAQAGPAAEYLRDLRVSIEQSSQWGGGVVGRAIRSRAPVVINQLWDSDGFQPWAERLSRHGIKSWAAFPLFEDGEPAAVLALYSGDSLAFDDGVAEVLREMAEDLSLALDRLALRSKQRKLEQELKRLKQAVEQSPIAIVMSDSTGAIEYVNPAFSATSGYKAEEVLGRNPRILKSGETSPAAYRAMWQKLLSGEAWSGEFHNRRKDGTLYWEEAVISPVKDVDGAITHYIALKQDVTARRQAEEKAQFLAFHDPLTELPNRLVAKSDANEAIARAKQIGGKFALLFIDVDNFKRVNDSLGHAIGDELLRALAKRLSSCMREGDGFSRVSGDEFLVIAKGIQDARSVENIAERIRTEASSPLNVGGIDISTTLSIGAAVYPDDGVTFDDLHRQADLAMYCAKREGRNTFRAYSRLMDSDAHDYLLTVNGIRRALDRGEFVLYYQPQVHLNTREVQGVEALIRWNHPELGLVGPSRFISVAEESGLIIEIGNWVISEVCRQAAEWTLHGFSNLRISANVSAHQLRRNLDRVISDALSQWHLEPKQLEIELTESALVHNSGDVAEILKRLKSFGVGIALDDFGTGYSNFTYLKHFDFDRLKIDQSFVRHITSNKGDAAIVKSIVQLARNFGLETIAEGVETQEVLKVVHRAGCAVVQGYLFARPMPARDLPTFIARQACVTSEPQLDLNKCHYFPPRLVQ